MVSAASGQKLADQQLCPAFTVRNNTIVYVNQEAEQLHLAPGMELSKLLPGNMQDYQALNSGRLYLTIELNGKSAGVTVLKQKGYDLFLLDDDSHVRLQALALAAKELRSSFSQVYFVTERMRRSDANFSAQTQAAYMQSTMQMQRLISNMADAIEYKKGHILEPDYINLTALFDEVFEKVSALLGNTGMKLCYHGLKEPVFAMADSNMLRRATYNLLSNAIKFSPRDGTVEAWLTQSCSHLQLTIQDSGSGVPENIQSSLFTRYQRPPCIEEGRLGLGLGMLLVRCTAIMHGGTVLLQQSPGKGAKISFTVSLQKPFAGKLHDPSVHADRFGGCDQALLELSDVLPLSAYE